MRQYPGRHVRLTGNENLFWSAFSLTVVVLAAAFTPSAEAQDATFFRIQSSPDGGGRTEAFGMSPDGTVVVGRQGLVGNDAFRWEGNDVIRLTSGASNATAWDASLGGEQVVYVSVGGGGDFGHDHSFVWSSATGSTDLGSLGGNRTHVRAISSDGSTIVGWSENADSQYRPFRYAAGAMTELYDGYGIAEGVSPDGHVAVGYVLTGPDTAPVVEAARWDDGALTILGRPGGVDEARALDASEGGEVIVGIYESSGTPLTDLGFIWTAADGFTSTGNFKPQRISADGTVVVGNIVDGVTLSNVAVWTEADGARFVQPILESLGFNMTGWRLTKSVGAARQGDRVIVGGEALNPLSGREAWRAEFPISGFTVLAPPSNALVDPGSTIDVRWSAAGTSTIDMYYTTDALPDSETGTHVPITQGLNAADGSYSWTVPEDLLSPNVRILIRDADDAARHDYGPAFRVRYSGALYRVVQTTMGTEYEAFDPEYHGWSFPNTSENNFPASYNQQPQFDYENASGGADPFSRLPYPSQFGGPPIFASHEHFPDWPSFVRAFGVDDTYTLLVQDVDAVYRPTALSLWQSQLGEYEGSCSGMSLAALMAFGDPVRFGARYPALGAPVALYDLPPSDDASDTVNELYNHWDGAVQRQWIAGAFGKTPRTTLEELRAMFRRDIRDSDSYLFMTNVDPALAAVASGAHAVVPYGIIADEENEGVYYVAIYDPNEPGLTPTILIDSTANRWFFPTAPVSSPAETAWGGLAGLFLLNPVSDYDTDAVFPLAPRGYPGKREDAPATNLNVLPAAGAQIRIAAENGESFGYGAGGVFNTILGASLNVAPVGGPTAHRSYSVPPGTYSMELTGFVNGLASGAIIEDGAIYGYSRSDATPEQVDNVEYVPGVGVQVGARDTGTRAITIDVVDWTSDFERQFQLLSIGLTDADSLSISLQDSSRLRVENGGGPKRYDLSLRGATATGSARFYHTSVVLAAGTVHVISPHWPDVGNSDVKVFEDHDGDGIIDDSLSLQNQTEPTGVEGDEGEGTTAGDTRRGKNPVSIRGAYPNPVASTATLELVVETTSRIRLEVFDPIGRRVAVLADEELAPGVYYRNFDASILPAGLYMTRATAGGALSTHPLVVVN